MSARAHPLSLRAKIVLILSAVVAVYAAFDHVVQQVFVYRSFVALEEARGRREITRVVAAIENEIAHIDLSCADWADRVDLRRYVEEPDPAFAASTFAPPVFERKGIDLLFVCATPLEIEVPDQTDELRKRVGAPPSEKRPDARSVTRMQRQEVIPVVWGGIADPVTHAELTLSDFPAKSLARQHPLIVVHDPACDAEFTMRERGLLMTEAGPLLVASKPILAADGSGRHLGTLILGRFLAGEMLDDLKERMLVDIEVRRLDDLRMPAEDLALIDEITASTGPLVHIAEEQTMHAYATLSDVRAAPVMLLRVNVQREISSTGATAVRYALLSTVAAGLLTMLVLLMLLQRTVLMPIARLTAHAVAIGRSEDFSRKLDLARDDEIGVLSREFDGMMEKLAQSRAAIVKAARAAGMSEIATGVLHNVGNVLNSVNVSATLVADKARNSGAADLKRALAIVGESAEDLAAFLKNDPRGAHLYPLLRSLADQLEREQSTILGEVRSLTHGIEHIKELIQSQQDYAGRSGLLETISLSEQIESALAMTGQTVGGTGIEIVREYEDLPALPVDRHRLIEVLVNLIQNARQSLQASTLDVRRLTLRLRAQEDERIRIEIEDSGVGIPPENLARIFTHGFTTKKTGHGFGLHASANAATEMGGRLYAESAGPGRGANFVLELPLHRGEPAGATA